ncbi:hypothetical protein B484DRAFT_408784, partial [Ochromonadaceae sp. CCMP2298]
RVRLFNLWFAAQCPSPSLLEAKVIPRFRLGAVATSAFAAEEVYLGVPTGFAASLGVMDAAVALRNSSVSILLAQLGAAYPRRDDFHELLFFLVQEMFVVGKNGLFWPYLALLPTYAEMLPLVPQLWTRAEIAERLGPSDLTRLVMENRDQTRARFEALKGMPLIVAHFPPHLFTFRHYQWATVILDSRSIWWGGKRHLVPMLDLVNCKEDVLNPSRLHGTELDAGGAFALTKA